MNIAVVRTCSAPENEEQKEGQLEREQKGKIKDEKEKKENQ